MRARLERLFDETFGGTPDVIARAPGRVNLIGEHTDYNDGFVLPCAIDRETFVAARKRNDGRICVVAGDLDDARISFAVAPPITPDADAPWGNYIRGVVDGLIESGLAVSGADLAIVGNMPRGAGLSSSAALENAAGLAIAAIAGQPDFDRTRLALIGQRAEHLFAGCKCGIMDQLVSARAKEGAALLIDCRSLDATAVEMPEGLAIMIIHSGIERGLVDGEYNMRRAQCEAAARHFGVKALRDLAELPPASGLDATSYARARHVITENARTLEAADALRRNDLAKLGELMSQSHASMRDDFAITLPPIDALAELVTDAIGAAGGARMTGGGFGGAVVALMPQHLVPHIEDTVRARYATPSGHPPDILRALPASGACLI